MQNKVFVLCGAPGTGKTTIRDYLVHHYAMAKVITHTTRPPRKNERDGQDYYFETPQSFKQNHYLEQVKYDRYCYGSSREGLKRAWDKRKWAAIVLDTVGAASYLKAMPNQTVVLYVKVSAKTNLKERLQKRGDKPRRIAERLQSFEALRDESLPRTLKGRARLILNDDWDQTCRQIKQVMKNEGH